MPLLRETAEALSNNHLVAGVIEEIITEDEMWNVLPVKQVSGKAYVYDREKSLTEPDFLDPNDTVNEGGATVDEVTARLRALIGDVDVDQFLNQTMDDTNDQEAIQIAQKAKALSRKWRNTMINGSAYTGTATVAPVGFITAIPEVSDAMGAGSAIVEIDVAPTPRVRLTAPGDAPGAWVLIPADGTYLLRSGNKWRYLTLTLDVSELGADDSNVTITVAASKSFTGLKYLVDPGQIILPAGANGDDLSFDVLDELEDMVKAGPVSAFIMHEKAIRAYKKLLRTSGSGTDAAMMQLDNFGKPILTINGKPVLKNNYITAAETVGTSSNCTRIYAAYFDEEKGVCGLGGGKNAGVVVQPVGIVQNKDAMRYRVKQYGAMAVHSTLSLACASGIKV